ncbi:MAG TPA: hypothetical protein VEJ87_05030 [Acidimicrobiales bacterium]|nr:hypothetical protein [Acidimicrobiales bacterium]
MTELSDLMVVFGAVDQFVTADESLIPTVAALIPAYNEGAAGWFEGISLASERIISRGGGPDGTELPSGATRHLPSIEEALTRLASPDFSLELATRRLLAIAVLGRVQRAYKPPPSGIHLDLMPDETLARALEPLTRASGFDTLEPQVQATRLLEILVNKEHYPDTSTWSAMTADAFKAECLGIAVVRQVLVPAEWTVIPSTEVGGPAVAFETHMIVQGSNAATGATILGDLTDILHPSKWTNYLPPWCDMNIMTGSHVPLDLYQEVIAFDCALTGAGGAGAFSAAKGWIGHMVTLTTILDFRNTPLPSGGGVLEYRLDPDQTNGDKRVSVDEGSLVVRQIDPMTTEVITTKRVQFRALKSMSPAEAAWLAYFVWLLGYANLAEYFVFRVAGKIPCVIKQPSSQFPGGAFAAIGAALSGCGIKYAGGGPSPVGGAGQSGWTAQTCGSLVSEVAKVVEECFEDCVCQMRSSLKKMGTGQYSQADYLSDVTKMSRHLVHHSTSFLKFGAETVPDHLHRAVYG